MPFSLASVDLFSLIAHLHPALVHLPIGILIFSLLISFLSSEKRTAYLEIWKLSLLMAAITSLLSCVAGYLLSQSGEYDPALVAKHQWLGIATCILSTASYFVVSLRRYLVWIAAVVMLVAGHFGGVLTHGEGYLLGKDYPVENVVPTEDTLNTSEKKDPSNVVEPTSTQVNVYRDQIAPILKNKCYSCHSSIKMKGGLRLDAESYIRKGGKHGLILHERNPSGSKMYANLILPEEDEDHMPPKGKKQLTEKEISLIHHWIGNGAPFGAVEVAVDPTPVENVPTVVVEEKTSEKKSSETIPTKASIVLPAVDPSIIEKLQQKGVSVIALNNGANELIVNFVNLKDIDASTMGMIQSVGNNIVELRMSGLKHSSAMMDLIKSSHNLKRLHLAKTGIGDEDMNAIASLTRLESLNIYGNAITDKSLEKLSSCKSLQQLYVWQTNVSANGVNRLQSALPTLKIDAGSFAFAKPDSAKK